MPNYFTLTKRGEDKPSNFSDIDAEICRAFGYDVHPKLFLAGWYDTIGLALAVGWTWDKMRETFEDKLTLRIIDYLDEHYIPNAWSHRTGRS